MALPAAGDEGPWPDPVLSLAGLGGIAGDNGTREKEGGLDGRLGTEATLETIGVLDGRGVASRSSATDGNRLMTDGEARGVMVADPGFVVGTEGKVGKPDGISSSSSIGG